MHLTNYGLLSLERWPLMLARSTVKIDPEQFSVAWPMIGHVLELICEARA